MRKKFENILMSSAFILTFITGCAPMAKHVWQSSPPSKTVDNEYFVATVTPASCDNWGCRSFLLNVKNKTNNNLEIDWNKTLYVVSEQTSGGFMLEGVMYKDRNNIKSPDIVFPMSNLLKNIFPNNLVEFTGRWHSRPFPPGDNGVYLTVKADGKEVNEKMMLSMFDSGTSSYNNGDESEYANFKRQEAAEIYVQASRCNDDKVKLQLLIKSREILIDIREKYPNSNVTKKVSKNIAMIENEIVKISPNALVFE